LALSGRDLAANRLTPNPFEVDRTVNECHVIVRHSVNCDTISLPAK
jgi:hypothetical protein